MLQERQVSLIRELLSDKDTMSRLNDNERQTLMQLSQCHHDDMTSPRKRYESLKSNTVDSLLTDVPRVGSCLSLLLLCDSL